MQFLEVDGKTITISIRFCTIKYDWLLIFNILITAQKSDNNNQILTLTVSFSLEQGILLQNKQLSNFMLF